VPSEIVIPPAAFWAAQGQMSFTGVVLSATFGSWLGSAISYWASRWIGRAVILRWGRYVLIKPDGLDRAEVFVRRYGVGGVFFARIFFAGAIVTVVPLAVGTIAATKLLGMSPLMVLGGLAGAQTCTPGLNALREASGSNVGSLAYTIPYAIGNIVLTLWGPVVVAIVHAMRGPS